MNTLPPIWQKILKFFHHLAVLGWASGLVISLFILHQLHGSPDAISNVPLNLLLFQIAHKIVTPSFFAVLLTALLFALFTTYGFFRFKWIIGKWILLALAYLIFSFVYLPFLHIMAALSDIGPQAAQNIGLNYNDALVNALIYGYVNLALLFGILVLTGFKPWGLRKGAEKYMPSTRGRAFVIAAVVIVAIFGFIGEIQFREMRNATITPVDLSGIISDTYMGEFDYHFNFKVKVILEDGIITEIKVLDNEKSLYAKLAEGIIYKILDEQQVNVDAVTGATTTSKALQKTIENALTD